MKTPITTKGYLKMLISIANDSVADLKEVKPDEAQLIAYIRAGIQNELGESEEILKRHKLKYTGL